jgi:polyisoprenoid-binding protein YceI
MIQLKKFVAAAALLVLVHSGAHSQVYLTRAGFVGFYSKMPLEDIKAENNQVFAAIDPVKKTIAFSLLLKGFVFTKQLMQEHFNENYVESDTYPKASFTGTFSGDLPLDKDGVYKVTAKGNLTLHNVTRPVETPATLEVKGGRILGQAEFKLKPEDFNISIPSVVRDKIAQEMRVNVRIDCGTNK